MNTSFPIIPLFSAHAVNAEIDALTPIQRVLNSYWYILGNEVAAFEQEFAAYCGVANCISLANGTDALELSLRAIGIKTGDQVILAANAGFYSSTAIHAIGAIPYYIDIEPSTLTLSVAQLHSAIHIQPKAIIATHLYGQMAEMEAIVELATTIGVPVIEDCAQAHGAMKNGKRAGSFGTIGCFSFYPTKNLGALGDGGAVITNDAKIAESIRQLRQYGWSSKYHVTIPGGCNSRLDELQAAVLRTKLPYLDANNDKRRKIANKYNQAFANLPMQCPNLVNADYVAHLYVIRLQRRNEFRDFLKTHGIMTDVHYPIPDHLQTAYSCSQGQGDLPITEMACNQVVSLPCFPGMTEDEINKVIEIVQKFV